MEQKQIVVRYANPAKTQTFKTDISLSKGDKVVIEGVRGVEIGEIISILDTPPSEEVKSIIRKATEKDISFNKELQKKIPEYLKKARKHILDCELDMKIINGEFTLDGSKIIITFTSAKRVDFRELVKRLAGDFRMKIELRQIGPRDAVQALGGIGPCGMSCCCTRNIGDIDHVSIKMAKNQSLPLNPTAISGICGKLFCCLAYENNQYQELLAQMPKVNSEVDTPEGKGKVIYNDIFKNLVTVRTENTTKKFKPEELGIKSYADASKPCEIKGQKEQEDKEEQKETKEVKIQAEARPEKEEISQKQEKKPAKKHFKPYRKKKGFYPKNKNKENKGKTNE